MPTFRTGVVTDVLEEREGFQRLRVDVDGTSRTAVLYARYAANAEPGHEVIVNTTATELGLGSGGDDFVVWNLAHSDHSAPSGGHIMKRRYTPAQSDVVSVEAPESPHHDSMAAATSLEEMPVVATSLHSQLLPVVAAIRFRRPQASVAYVMTDGGALEAGLSRTVRRLRELGWISGVVTCGHATGGDLEAVNVYSALLATRAVLRCDVAVAGMGPGVVGTATSYGTTALELGLIVNAAATLGGRPVACVRMSSGDARDRHTGVSHHSAVSLRSVALASADVAVPRGRHVDVGDGHRVVEVDTDPIDEALAAAVAQGLEPLHMGRGPDEDRLFFLAAGAAGLHAADLLGG